MTDKQVIQTAIKVLTHGKYNAEDNIPHFWRYDLHKWSVLLWLSDGMCWLVSNIYSKTGVKENFHKIFYSKHNESVKHLGLIISLVDYDFFNKWKVKQSCD